MPKQDAVVAIYSTHTAAEQAVKDLQSAGFDMKQLSIVGRDYHTEDHVVGYYSTGDRMKAWGKIGAFWGGLWGLLVGAAFFVIPGIGPVVIAGSLVSGIVAALEGAAVGGGLSALGAGLVSLGIPRDSILKYESAIKADEFLLVAHGTPEDVDRAKQVIEKTSAKEFAVHHQ